MSDYKLYSGSYRKSLVETDNAAMQLQFVAKEFRFDPTGFSHERPLRRSVFYAEPYLTCIHCNTIFFLDIVQIRHIDAIIDLTRGNRRKSIAKIEPVMVPKNEYLLPCSKCKRVDGFCAGAKDFSDYIEEQKRQQRLLLARQHSAAILIGITYRNYLHRKYIQAVRTARLTAKYRKSKAATAIQSLARARLARRRFSTENHLVMISNSHPLLIRYALRIVPGQPRVFWYRRKVELDLIYFNYLDLIQRLGYQPPRIIVERNIAELSRRIFERKNQLIVMLQRRWRGFLGRRIVRYFRTEVHRIFSISVFHAMQIQATYRGHYVRLHIIPKLKFELQHAHTMHNYQENMHDMKLLTNRQIASEMALIAYKQERGDEKVARFMDKNPYLSELQPLHQQALIKRQSDTLQGPMTIFHQSPYGDPRSMTRNQNILQKAGLIVEKSHQQDIHDETRKHFILARIAETGPLGYGLRSGISRNENTGFSLKMEKKECSRSRAMRYYFQHDLQRMSEKAFERVSHMKNAVIVPSLSLTAGGSGVSTSNRLTQEFRKFNQERLGNKQAIAYAEEQRLLHLQQGSLKSSRRNSSRRNLLRSQSSSLHGNSVKPITPKKPVNSLRRSYKFPDNINFKAIDWLFNGEDDEDLEHGHHSSGQSSVGSSRKPSFQVLK